MTTAGKGALREGGRGQQGDETPPTTQATRAHGDRLGDDKLMGGPRTAPPPYPQRRMAADDSSTETPTRHTAGTDDARQEHYALACCKYGLLASTGTAVDPSNAGDPGSKDGHGATW